MNICVLLIECYLCLTLTATSVYLSYKAEIYKTCGWCLFVAHDIFHSCLRQLRKNFPWMIHHQCHPHLGSVGMYWLNNLHVNMLEKSPCWNTKKSGTTKQNQVSPLNALHSLKALTKGRWFSPDKSSGSSSDELHIGATQPTKIEPKMVAEGCAHIHVWALKILGNFPHLKSKWSRCWHLHAHTCTAAGGGARSELLPAWHPSMVWEPRNRHLPDQHH